MGRFHQLFFLAASLIPISVQADYEDGLVAAENGDYAKAFLEFTQAAEEGLDLAQYNLAILYYAGQGVKQDLEQVYYWTMKAAEQGHVAAQFNLGALYYEGDGVKRDREQAFEWYSKAAAAEYPPAQFNIAEMYYFGQGVDKNLVLAHAWINRAIENEYEYADELYKDIEDDMSPDQLSEARREFARMKIGR